VTFIKREIYLPRAVFFHPANESVHYHKRQLSGVEWSVCTTKIIKKGGETGFQPIIKGMVVRRGPLLMHTQFMGVMK
jgi:hypothetical protein